MLTGSAGFCWLVLVILVSIGFCLILLVMLAMMVILATFSDAHLLFLDAGSAKFCWFLLLMMASADR